MSKNANPANNNRDMSIGYLVAAAIYALIGIFGCYGIAGRSHPASAETITQYFDSTSVPPFIINLFFASHLITAFPLFCFVSRTQFLNLIFRKNEPKKWAILLYNVVFILSCCLINTLNISIGSIIGFTGAVVGFVIVYLLPILIHLKCIYRTRHTGIAAFSFKKANNNDDSTVSDDHESNNHKSFSCDAHEHLIVERHPYARFAFYLAILLIGVYLAVIQLLELF